MKTVTMKYDHKNIKCSIMSKYDKEVGVIAKNLQMTHKQKEDLLEEQRPNVINFDKYSIITLLYPTHKNNTDLRLMQMNIILNNREVNIITNEDNKMIDNAFNELITLKDEKDTGITVSHIIDSVREQSIDIFDSYETYLKDAASLITKGSANKKTLIKLQEIRTKLFYIQTALKGNVEVIKELLEGDVKYVKHMHFGEHHDDREMYLLDLVQSLIESTKANIETYISQVSERLNKQIYKLTIIGSILIIPTIISGYFGMNVQLPPIGFAEIVIASIILSIIIYYFIK